MADELSTLTPTFIVYINGSRLAVDQEAAVKQILVQDRLDSPSSLSIVLSDPQRQWTDCADFDEGNQIRVELGYKDDVAEVFNGEVTGLLADFRRGNDSLVTVKAHNALHRLCSAKKTLHYTKMSDSEIVKEIISDAGLTLKADDFGSEHAAVTRTHQTDYEFVMHLAHRYGCRVWAEKTEVNIQASPDRGDESPVVEWGKTLLEFRVESDTRGLVTEVEVQGWDQETSATISGNAKAADLAEVVGGDEVGAKVVEKNFSPTPLIIVDREIGDESTADDLALEFLTKNSFDFITGSGRAEGNPKIVAGGSLTLKAVSDRFGGEYRVDAVRHTFDSISGYASAFTVSRNAR